KTSHSASNNAICAGGLNSPLVDVGWCCAGWGLGSFRTRQGVPTVEEVSSFKGGSMKRSVVSGVFSGRSILITALTLLVLIHSSTARAGTVNGSIFFFPDDTVPGNAIPANVPATTPDVTFTVNTPIAFDSAGLFTVGEFLASGGATVLTGAANLSHTLGDTLFNFTGTVTVTTGQTFTAGHDDGLTLIIGGLKVIDAPLPTAFAVTTVTYTGPSGNLPFQLVY